MLKGIEIRWPLEILPLDLHLWIFCSPYGKIHTKHSNFGLQVERNKLYEVGAPFFEKVNFLR